ncbi:MAG: AAA family ATPase [Thermodesulfobacteriota bacterium]
MPGPKKSSSALPPLVRAMKRPGFYSHAPEDVTLIQTHISWVFLAGGLVYKVKKPVTLPFLDFSTLALRKTFCDLELRLNKRLAPETYQEVVPVFARGKAFTLSPCGEPVEYAVVMKRLPEEGMFTRMLAEGRLLRRHMELTASLLCSFHAAADTNGTVDLIGRIGFIGRNHTENFTSTEKYAGAITSRAQHGFLWGFGDRFLREHAGLFASRVKNHRIRDCHGDLHLGNICLDGERLVIFDCIEFSRHFRYEDVAAEVAFLAMDLEFNGAFELSRSFSDTYVKMSADSDILPLLRFYKFYRACVRAKVHCIRSSDPSVARAERREAETLAARYLDLAASYAARPEKPCLFAVMGLSGSGKSSVARELARLTGASLLQSDVIRKEIFRVPRTERRLDDYGQGLYNPRATERTYAELFSRAEALLARNTSVILDATFLQSVHRETAFSLGRKFGADFYGAWCSCPEDETRRRLESRTSQKDEPSDGRFETYLKQKELWEPPRQIYAHRIFALDTMGPPRDLAFTALARFFGGKGPGTACPATEC